VALHVLCYNLTRATSIIGIQPLVAAMTRELQHPFASPRRSA
jgi:hypothetical protein